MIAADEVPDTAGLGLISEFAFWCIIVARRIWSAKRSIRDRRWFRLPVCPAAEVQMKGACRKVSEQPRIFDGFDTISRTC